MPSKCPWLPFSRQISKRIVKLKLSTLTLFGTALALTAAAYMYETQFVPQQEAAKDDRKVLFSFEEQDIVGLQVTDPRQTLQFDRLEEKDDRGEPLWEIRVVVPEGEKPPSPDRYRASNAVVSFFTSQLANLKGDRTVTLQDPEKERADFGLAEPVATVEISLANGDRHTLTLGDADFSERFRYVQTGAIAQEDIVATVPANLMTAVDRTLADWEAADTPLPPPEAPFPLPTIAPEDVLQALPSPGGSATPLPEPTLKTSPSPEASPTPAPTPATETLPSPDTSPTAAPQPPTKEPFPFPTIAPESLINRPAIKTSPSPTPSPVPAPDPTPKASPSPEASPTPTPKSTPSQKSPAETQN